MFRRILRLTESYNFVLFVSLAAGILLSGWFSWLSAYSRYLLEGIFFLSALRLNLADVVGQLRDRRMLLAFNVLMMLVFPAVVYLIVNAVAPEFALAFLLLAAMPAGMTSPLLTEITGGNAPLALILTVTTSLAAPLTVPLVINVMAGADVAVGFWSMVLTLAKIIIIPFVLAQLVKYFFRNPAKRFASRSRPVSMLLLGLLITGIVAARADIIIAGVQSYRTLLYLAGLAGLFVAHLAAGYWLAFWRDRGDRIAVMVCLTFMNFTLAIFLAGQFFPQPDVLVPVILSVLPWSVGLIPFRTWFGRT